MKKIICLCLSVVLLLGVFAACGETDVTPEDSTTVAETTTETTTQATTTSPELFLGSMVTRNEVKDLLYAKGWQNIYSESGGLGQGFLLGSGSMIHFQEPSVADDEIISAVIGVSFRGEDHIAIAVMHAYSDAEPEGRMIGVFYASESQNIGAEHFGSEILHADDERLWDFMLSYDN